MIITDVHARFRIRVAVELAAEALLSRLGAVAAECGLTGEQVEDHLYALGERDHAEKWAAWAEAGR